jgi:hypothetical protein
MANEYPTWGSTRIRGALQHLSHDLARNTIKAISISCACPLEARI